MKKNALIILLLNLTMNLISYNVNSQGINVDFTTIRKDNLYGAGNEGINKQNMVITDENTWTDLLTQMNLSSTLPEFDINFSRYTIIAVFDNIRGSKGYSVELDVRSTFQNIIVSITEISPVGDSFTVISQPYNIIRIRNSSLPIIFENVDTTLDVNDFLAEKEISFFPNPTNDFFYINSKNSFDVIHIYSIAGKLIKSYKKSDNNYDISNFPPGMYLVKIQQTQNKTISIKKLIVN